MKKRSANAVFLYGNFMPAKKKKKKGLIETNWYPKGTESIYWLPSSGIHVTDLIFFNFLNSLNAGGTG